MRLLCANLAHTSVNLLRRRLQRTRQRAELLTHGPQIDWQYNLPELGRKIAYQAHRHEGAARFTDPAVHKSVAVDLALLDYYDQ